MMKLSKYILKIVVRGRSADVGSGLGSTPMFGHHSDVDQTVGRPLDGLSLFVQKLKEYVFRRGDQVAMPRSACGFGDTVRIGRPRFGRLSNDHAHFVDSLRMGGAIQVALADASMRTVDGQYQRRYHASPSEILWADLFHQRRCVGRAEGLHDGGSGHKTYSCIIRRSFVVWMNRNLEPARRRALVRWSDCWHAWLGSPAQPVSDGRRRTDASERPRSLRRRFHSDVSGLRRADA